MNIPYVKKYDENGTLLNPINKVYKSTEPNRRERHSKLGRFLNNSRNNQQIVNPLGRFKKLIQFVSGKKIIHYLNPL